MSDSFFPYKLNNSRYPDEDFKTYQLRRWNENMVVRMYLKGQLVWNSTQKGTLTADTAANSFEMKLV